MIALLTLCCGGEQLTSSGSEGQRGNKRTNKSYKTEN